MINTVEEYAKTLNFGKLYIVSDHTGFYERYGWEFYCMAQGDDEPEQTRLYKHE